jgi:gliding motility-associated-like protein
MVDAGPDRIMIVGDSIKLNAKAEGEDLSYAWTPNMFINKETDLDPFIKPISDINYTLAATSKYGCSNQDKTFVKVVQDIFIPNAFTPNDDGKNDSWKIPFLDPAFNADVTVFNRYGELVYHSKGSIVSWDGTIRGNKQTSGTYVYMVKIGSGFQRVGTITLIR